MRYFRIATIAVCVLALSGCIRSQRPLNPPYLVSARDTDIAIQLFMQATILLGRYYNFHTLDYEDLQDRSVRHGYQTLPLMPPISRRATPRFDQKSLPSEQKPAFHIPVGDKFRNWADANGGRTMLLQNYVRTGWRAAQLICRNYLIGLEERNAYLEFLQREFNIGTTLANASLIAAGANVTLRAIGVAVDYVGNEAIDAYQAYRFLDIDRDAARTLVESAQNLIADEYLKAIKAGKVKDSDFSFYASFSEAVHAVSLIEYQCTRSGIRGLISKAGVAASAKKGAVMHFDVATNQIEFKEPPKKDDCKPCKQAAPGPDKNTIHLTPPTPGSTEPKPR